MANTNTPFGFKPVGYFNGSPWDGKFNIYYAPTGSATALYKGDLVTMAGSGSTDGLYPDIQAAAASDITIVGVAIGFGLTPNMMANANNLGLQYRPASTAMYVAVVDDPDVIFEAQEDGALAVTAIGNNIDFVATTGSATTGISAMVLDSDVIDPTTAYSLRLLRLANRPDNALGTYAKWNVMINGHIYRTTAGS
jgi:hypothetical protein